MANRNKGFNPFKMWGSYVGLVVGIILGFFVPKFLGMDCSVPIACGIFSIMGVGGGLILGFILGYGIHATVRGIRRLM